MKYKYFENVRKNATFTDTPCQFCGNKMDCLEGVFFEKDDLTSICLTCFEQGREKVFIPEEIIEKIREKRKNKVEELGKTPPVSWIQYNEWPVCCDEFMTYIGEWNQNDFNDNSTDGDGLKLLKKTIDFELKERVENFDILWNELGNEAAAFVFKCNHCGKIITICQEY